MTAGRPVPPEVLQAFRDARRFLLAAQVGADGDRLGSMVALAGALGKMGKRAVPWCPEPIPRPCREIPGVERVASQLPAEEFDAVVVLKCPSPERFPPGMSDLGARLPLVNIDHSPLNEGYGTARWVEPRYAAAGEMVFDLMEPLGVELDAHMARALYIAIFSATGSFQFGGVGRDTHLRVARLLESGIPTDRIARVFYRERDFRAVKLLGRILRRLGWDAGGRVVWAALGLEELRSHAVDPEETGWFVDVLDQIQGVDVAVLFREMPGGRVKVSFRSKGTAIHPLAARLGGGGLPGAAACRLDGDLEDVRRLVLASLREVLPPGASSVPAGGGAG